MNTEARVLNCDKMPTAEDTTALFSYGTLQDEAVQLATFGRRLDGQPDALVGYKLTQVPIEDPRFITADGVSRHRNIEFTGVPSDLVKGTVLQITSRELEAADGYEPAYYRRVSVRLQSGRDAWVYLKTDE